MLCFDQLKLSWERNTIHVAYTLPISMYARMCVRNALSLVRSFVFDGHKSSGFFGFVEQIVVFLGNGDWILKFLTKCSYRERWPLAVHHVYVYTHLNRWLAYFIGERRQQQQRIFFPSFFFVFHFISSFFILLICFLNFWPWAQIIYDYVNCSRICPYKCLNIFGHFNGSHLLAVHFIFSHIRAHHSCHS